MSGQMAHQAEAYPVFRCIKRQGIFYFPLHEMLVYRKVKPQNLILWHPFIHLSGERHCESQVSGPRHAKNTTQCLWLAPRSLDPELISRLATSLAIISPWIPELKKERNENKKNVWICFHISKKTGAKMLIYSFREHAIT